MNDFKKKGYFVLRDFFKADDFAPLRRIVDEEFLTINKLPDETKIKLDVAHRAVKPAHVKYLSMGYENQRLEQEITRVVNSRLTDYVKDKLLMDIEIEPGASFITLFPHELTGYNVKYHQDEDVKNEFPSRIHVVTPLLNNPLNLIQVLDSTHDIGTFEHSLFGPLLRISDKRLDQYLGNNTDIHLNFGDVIFFYTSLIHRVQDNVNSDLSHWMLRFIYKVNTDEQAKQPNEEKPSE